ncbi:MAG: hypothetical protein K8S15_05555, partial [Candidatus Aegiribacteria sp.]|nr:hypothetical protein [Candidatus Aegiribacteria sp.]
MDPPVIIWTNELASYFYDVHETSDGGFIVAGRKGSGPDKSVFLFDSYGNLVWEYGVSGYDYYQHARWIEEVPSGGYIATGCCRLSSSSSYTLFIARIDAEGNEEWKRLFGFEDSYEIGYCILPLPDGGFAVCGEINPQTGMDQAWLLRTDSNGDTLWTDIWGEYSMNHARRVIYNDGLLKVLSFGRIHPDSAKGTHLLTYDLNGNLLSEVRIAALGGDEGVDMCYSPSDGGYTIVTNNNAKIAHTDSLGNAIWYHGVSGYGFPEGYSVNRTMDQGYIYGGQNVPNPDYPWQVYSGMIVRYDYEGNELWLDYVYNSDC